jgi:hypothetical protein
MMNEATDVRHCSLLFPRRGTHSFTSPGVHCTKIKGLNVANWRQSAGELNRSTMIIRFNHVVAASTAVVVTSVLLLSLSSSSAVQAFSSSVVVVVPSAAIATRRIAITRPSAGRRSITSINQFYDANGSPDDVKNEKYQRQMMVGQQQPLPPQQQPPQFQPQQHPQAQQMYVKDAYGNLVPPAPPCAALSKW